MFQHGRWSSKLSSTREVIFFLTNVEDVDPPNTMNAALHSTRHTRAESTIEYKQEDHAGTLSLVAAGIILDRATEYWRGTLPNT